MQEEMEKKAVAISIKAGKLSANFFLQIGRAHV